MKRTRRFHFVRETTHEKSLRRINVAQDHMQAKLFQTRAIFRQLIKHEFTRIEKKTDHAMNRSWFVSSEDGKYGKGVGFLVCETSSLD